MKSPPSTGIASVSSSEMVGRVVVRGGRTLTLFTNPAPTPSAMSAYERSLLTPVCRLVDLDEEAADLGVCAPPSPNSKRIGTRNKFIKKVGRRVRRVFFVAPEDVVRDDAWLGEPGWYVDTVRPPACWISNDPLGPYPTLAELQADTYPAYRKEED